MELSIDAGVSIVDYEQILQSVLVSLWIYNSNSSHFACYLKYSRKKVCTTIGKSKVSEAVEI